MDKFLIEDGSTYLLEKCKRILVVAQKAKFSLWLDNIDKVGRVISTKNLSYGNELQLQ